MFQTGGHQVCKLSSCNYGNTGNGGDEERGDAADAKVTGQSRG